MNSPDFAESEGRLDELAAEWIFEREEGFSTSRAQTFQAWCSQDPRHAAAVARVDRMMALLDGAHAHRDVIETAVPARTSSPARSPGPRMVEIRPWIWMAGLAAIFVLGIMVYRIQGKQTPERVEFVTNAADLRRVALTDGSVVDLNANSNVRVSFSDRRRDVHLVAGEAHFQVAHNAERPFVVTAHGVSVRAIGTVFDVRVAGDQVEVLVTEGRVQVERRTSGWLRSTTTAIVPQLSAGERAQIAPNVAAKPAIESVDAKSARALLSWQDQMTAFNDVPLREMVARFNRCNSVELVIDDPTLSDRRIGGVFALNQVDAFVNLLEQTGGIVVERRESRILLRSAP